MHRINTYDSREKWRWACPAPDRHRDWRVVDGLFECRSCGETYRELVNLETGERVERSNIEVVGSHAGHKGALGRPTVEDQG
jgi:ribosomal protein L37AE/L43A